MSTESAKYLLRYTRQFVNHYFYAPPHYSEEACEIEFEAEDDNAASELAIEKWTELTEQYGRRERRGSSSEYTGECTFVSLSYVTERNLAFFDVEEAIRHRKRKHA